MGEVYRAKDQKLGRDVAIKILPEEFARDPERLSDRGSARLVDRYLGLVKLWPRFLSAKPLPTGRIY